MSDQTDTELQAFRHFVAAAGLPVIAESVQKRLPPEPDIRCRLKSGIVLAFEVVEICNPTNVRFVFSAQGICDAIRAAHESLPARQRASFDERFGPRPLSFHFKREASEMLIRKVLPRLLTELITAPLSGDEFVSFSPLVASAVVKVRFAGRAEQPNAFNFNLGSEFDPNVPLDAIAAKLSKNYRADCPVELLAYFGAWAWGRDRSYCEVFLRLFRERGLGRFRRAWVMDWNGIAMAYPDRPTPAE